MMKLEELIEGEIYWCRAWNNNYIFKSEGGNGCGDRIFNRYVFNRGSGDFNNRIKTCHTSRKSLVERMHKTEQICFFRGH